MSKRRFDGKTEIIPWKTFFTGEYKIPSKMELISIHVERNKVIYKFTTATIILILISDTTAFAASSTIDAKAKGIYFGKLLGFGKWALIIKGGWDSINKAIKEDFDGAKKTFFSYLLVYIFLHALPWGMDQVEDVFK